VARAQQPVKVWRVGYLSPSSASDKAMSALFDAFRLKLQDLGYVDGKNLRLDVRNAESDYARLPVLAAELVAVAPHVIVGPGSASTAALQRATTSIPIVMASVADPVGSGFVKSLSKPGGNITGTSNLAVDLAAKSLELLHAVAPNAKHIAVLMLPSANHEPMVEEAVTAAGALGVTIIPVMTRTPADLDDAFVTINKNYCDGLVVLPRLANEKLVELAAASRLPAIYNATGFVDLGGLLSYSANFTELLQETAIYVDKIIKGASPADLPVEQPTRLELQVNLKTAKALGLTFPASILARADEVIE
jgi:putative tryptophan/tyrosine transport system substrate-binding protein